MADSLGSEPPEYYIGNLAKRNCTFTSKHSIHGNYRCNTLEDASARKQRLMAAQKQRLERHGRRTKQLKRQISRMERVQDKLVVRQQYKVKTCVKEWGALVIQKQWKSHQRGKLLTFLRRRGAARKIAGWAARVMDKQKDNLAAVALQAKFRQFKGQMTVLFKRRSNKAATKLQARFRCHSTRLWYLKKMNMQRSVSNTVRQLILNGAARAFFIINKTDNFAATIQRAYRRLLRKRRRLEQSRQPFGGRGGKNAKWQTARNNAWGSSRRLGRSPRRANSQEEKEIKKRTAKLLFGVVAACKIRNSLDKMYHWGLLRPPPEQYIRPPLADEDAAHPSELTEERSFTANESETDASATDDANTLATAESLESQNATGTPQPPAGVPPSKSSLMHRRVRSNRRGRGRPRAHNFDQQSETQEEDDRDKPGDEEQG